MTSTTIAAETTRSVSSSGDSIMDWILDHRKAFLAFLLILLVGVGVMSALKAKRAATDQKAAQALFEAKKLGFETDAGIAALEKVSKDFAGTRVAWESLMLIGDHHVKKSPTSDSAATWYEKADPAATDPRERLLARYNLAHARELQGKWDQALAAIESAQRLGLPLLKSELALTQARLLERSGKIEEARRAYDSIANEFAKSDAGNTAEQWRALLPPPAKGAAQ